jgi:hypothetical protein
VDVLLHVRLTLFEELTGQQCNRRGPVSNLKTNIVIIIILLRKKIHPSPIWRISEALQLEGEFHWPWNPFDREKRVTEPRNGHLDLIPTPVVGLAECNAHDFLTELLMSTRLLMP